MLAGELFEEGKTRAEVARELGVTWRAAHNWHQRWQESGLEALRARGRPGPAHKISQEQLGILEMRLREGPGAYGYQNNLWTLPRVARVVEVEFGEKLSTSESWRLLRRMGWSSQKPIRKARERDEQAIEKWKNETWSAIRDKAVCEGRTIVFVDESGLTQKPATKKTWSPEGNTPQVEMNFSWKTLSVIGGITLRSIFFQIHEESIKSAQVIEFLTHLQRHIEGKLLVIWDGLPAHRSKEVKAYLTTTEGRIWLERLPAYAPELNPIEYLWGHLKNTALANFAPAELHELSSVAKKALRKTRKRPACIRAFWIQSELDLEGM